MLLNFGNTQAVTINGISGGNYAGGSLKSLRIV